MILRYFIYFAFASGVGISTANGQLAPNLDKMMLLKISDRSVNGDPSKEPAKGSPYLSEKFTPATIIVKKTTFKDVPMRYNVYEDIMEFKKNKDNYIIDPQLGIEKVSLEGITLIVNSYEDKGKAKLGFFIRLDSGKVSMLMKKSVTFRDQQPPKPLEVGPTPPTYTKGPDTYYYEIGSDAPVKVESIKKLVAAFPDKQAELSAFVKKEKISKDDEGLVKLGKYLNSIMSNP